jgi:DNA-directed RNA polymerase subunit M/transcription elongation factor TFIIS
MSDTESEEVTVSIEDSEEVTESVGEVDDSEEESVEELDDSEVDRKELSRKYDLLSSKLVGDKTTYKELKKGVDNFDLSIWNDCKVSEQTAIEFETRKKKMVTGLYTCGKCGCNEVYTQAIQMRSGDEATDNFALCSKCQHLWRV